MLCSPRLPRRRLPAAALSALPAARAAESAAASPLHTRGSHQASPCDTSRSELPRRALWKSSIAWKPHLCADGAARPRRRCRQWGPLRRRPPPCFSARGARKKPRSGSHGGAADSHHGCHTWCVQRCLLAGKGALWLGTRFSAVAHCSRLRLPAGAGSEMADMVVRCNCAALRALFSRRDAHGDVAAHRLDGGAGGAQC